MPRKKMSDEERAEVSNRMKKYWAQRRSDGNGSAEKKPKKKPAKRRKKTDLPGELVLLKKQTLGAARFIESCGSTSRAKEVFGMVVNLAEKLG